MAKHRVVVLLSDNEYARVRGMAGEVALSRWFRYLAFRRDQKVDWSMSEVGVRAGHVAENPEPAKPELEAAEEKILIPPGPDIEPVKQRAAVKKVCPHGNSTGHFCMSCNRTVE